MSHIILLLLLSSVAMSQTETSTEAIYPASLISISNDPNFSQVAFLVDKSKRTLRVYKTDGDLLQLLEEHPTDVGKNNGDKVKVNDKRTPDGTYFLMEKKNQPEIPFSEYGSIAFTTDYPNIFDKRVAKSGSGIWLHAVPDKVPLTRGSRGCVVVRNDIIQQLSKYVTLGQTPLVISEKVEYLTKEKYIEQKNKYLSHFEKWRSSWEKSDVDTYIKFYDETFKTVGMDYSKWYNHKKKLKGLYQFIKVELLSPTILRNNTQVVIRTSQKYESDLHQDFGEKTIHANYSDEVGFKIIREDWRPILKN
jgi:murein L,D-transpeptidase YafK